MREPKKPKPRWLGPRETRAMGKTHKNFVQNARRALNKGKKVPWARKHTRDDGKTVWLIREDVVSPPRPKHIEVKRAASLVGVTESTMGRWYDDGHLPADKKAEKEAGHRKLLREPFLAMLPELKARAKDPHALGLEDPDHMGVTEAARMLRRDRDWVRQKIRDGSIPWVKVEGGKRGRKTKIPREPFMGLVPSLRRKGKRAKRSAGPGLMSKSEAMRLLGFRTASPVDRLIGLGHIELDDGGRILSKPFKDDLSGLRTLANNPNAGWEEPGMVTTERGAEILGCNSDTFHRLIEAGEIKTAEGPDWKPGRPRKIPVGNLRRDATRLKTLIRTHYSKRGGEHMGTGEMATLLGVGRMAAMAWIDNGMIPSENRETRQPGEKRLVRRDAFIAALPRLVRFSRERLFRVGGRTREKAEAAWRRSVEARGKLPGWKEGVRMDQFMSDLLERERVSTREASDPGVISHLLNSELTWVARASESEMGDRTRMTRREYVRELRRRMPR